MVGEGALGLRKRVWPRGRDVILGELLAVGGADEWACES